MSEDGAGLGGVDAAVIPAIGQRLVESHGGSGAGGWRRRAGVVGGRGRAQGGGWDQQRHAGQGKIHHLHALNRRSFRPG